MESLSQLQVCQRDARHVRGSGWLSSFVAPTAGLAEFEIAIKGDTYPMFMIVVIPAPLTSRLWALVFGRN